jgi:hypothetical protein
MGPVSAIVIDFPADVFDCHYTHQLKHRHVS